MRNKIVMVVLSVALVVSLVLVGCAKPAPVTPTPVTPTPVTPTPAPEEEVIHWKFQCYHPLGALSSEVTVPHFIERVREMSNGRLDISLHYSGELVKNMEVFPALEANTIQIANTGGLLWRGDVPVGWLQSANLPPFVYRTNDEFHELYHYRGLDKLMKEGWAERGIYFLGSHNVGNTYFWSSKPLYGVEDLKGFKVRFFGAMSDTMEHFGAAPVFIPHEETYMGIKTGVIDGGGTCWWLYRDLKLYEVCPYFIGPPWQTPQGMELWVSMKAWNALPDEIKAMIETANKALQFEYSNLVTMQERDMFHKSFPEWGTTYIEWGEEDVAKVREFSVEYLDQVAAEVGPKDPRVAQGIDIIKQFMEDYGYID